jgi:hypothetical protein
VRHFFVLRLGPRRLSQVEGGIQAASGPDFPNILAQPVLQVPKAHAFHAPKCRVMKLQRQSMPLAIAVVAGFAILWRGANSTT